MIKITKRFKKLNPTDHNLISKLTVKKSFPGYGIMYEVYLGKKRIGFADIDKGKTEISFVDINTEYRRKGVSTFLYDYIEKDLGRKLKPSEDLIEDGQAFWKNRNKRNPRDGEFLKKIKIEKTKFRPFDKTEDLYQIFYNNKNIGHALYDPNSKTIEDVSVYEEFRQKGVATFIHDYIEKDLKIKLKPNSVQTWHGKAFWENRLKKNPSLKRKLK